MFAKQLKLLVCQTKLCKGLSYSPIVPSHSATKHVCNVYIHTHGAFFLFFCSESDQESRSASDKQNKSVANDQL